MPAITDARILIVATDGFEETELFGPLESLRGCGAKVTLASPELDEIQGEKGDQPSRKAKPDALVSDVSAQDYDGLVLPGGVRNPDTLRMNEDAVRLIRDFAAAGKPIAAICHGPWLLIEADVIRDKTVTGWPSIRTDLRNAGATVVDEEVVTSDNIITSRMPEDVPAFVQAFTARIEAAPAAREPA